MSIKNPNRSLNQSLIANDSSILFTLLKNTKSSVFLQNCEFKFTKILNPPANLKEEDFLGLTDFDILPAEQALQISKIKEDVLVTGKPYDGNLQLSFDGAQKSYNIKIDPLFDDNCNINGLISTYAEISDIIKPSSSTEGYSVLDINILRNIQDGIAIYKVLNDGEDFIFEYMNPAGERLSHVKLKDIKGKSVHDIFPAIEEMGLLDVFRKVWKTGKRGVLPLTLYRDDIVSQWVENYVYKTPNDEILAVYLDMTERLETEKKIRENEERLSLVLQGAQLGLWDQDFKNNKIIRNDRWYEMLGYSREEINSDAKSFRDLVHPDDLPKLLKAVEEHESGKSQLLDVEVRVKAKNGEWIWIYNCGKIVERDKNGKPIRALGIHRDITKRKNIEEKIKESEMQSRAIFEQAAVGVARVAPDGKYLVVNQKFCDIVGYSKPELLKKAFRDITHPDDLKEELEYDKQILAGSINTYTLEKRYFHKDGHIIWINMAVNLIRDVNNVPQYFIAVIEDITERKQSQMALEKSEAHLKSLLETIPDMIWVKDPDGVYLSCNQRFEKSFGVKEEEIVGHTDYDFLSKKEADFSRKMDRLAIEAGKPTMNEEEVTFASDGHKELLETLKTPMYDSSDKLMGVLGIARDITKRKQLEETLLDSEKRFLSIINHIDQVYYIHDTNKVLSYISPQCKEYFGYTQDEMKVKWTKILSDNPINKVGIELIEKAIKTGTRQKPYLLELKSKDNTTIFVEVNESPIKDSDGKVIGIAGALMDVTEKLNAENALRKSELRLKEAQHLAKIGNWELDLVTKTLFWSEEVYDIFNIKPQQFNATYKAFLENVHPDDRDAVDKAYSDSVKNKTPYNITHRILLKDNIQKVVNERCETLYDDKGIAIRSIGTVQDITEINKAKIELEKLNNELFQERVDLQFKNVALREVMHQIEDEKKEIAHNMQVNIDKSIKPMFARLEKQLAKKEKTYLANIQKELEQLTSPYLNKLTSVYSDLSPRDIEICNLIKNGHSSKEIAEYFRVSEEAIRSRRKIIRRKIKIASKDINLATYLQSLK